MTLHNEDYIKGIGGDGEQLREGREIMIGDTVIVQRAGDVIPQIVDVEIDKRPKGATSFHFPKKCPCPLHTDVVRETIARLAISDPKQAGRVTGEIMKANKGKFEPSTVKRLVEAELAAAATP